MPLDPGPLQVLNRPPLLDEDRGEWIAKDRQLAMLAPEEAEMVGQRVACLFEQNRFASHSLGAGKREGASRATNSTPCVCAAQLAGLFSSADVPLEALTVP